MKSGFVAVVGRPNVGKSTLINGLVGSKVAITSTRPQTTRNVLRGVVDLPERDAQIVLVDTPGHHRPRTALGQRLNKLVYGSLSDADAAILVLDATEPIGPGDRMIAERLQTAELATVVAVNKVDLAGPDEVAVQLAEAGEWDFAAYVPTSATKGAGLGPLVDELLALLPEGPAYFPPGSVSDQPEDLLIAEIVREKFLDRLRDELPHSLAVVVDDRETRDNGTEYIGVRLYVERESQKGIVIGKGGSLLAAAGEEARKELEALLDTKVYLDMRVRVEKEWQRREGLLDRLGF